MTREFCTSICRQVHTNSLARLQWSPSWWNENGMKKRKESKNKKRKKKKVRKDRGKEGGKLHTEKLGVSRRSIYGEEKREIAWGFLCDLCESWAERCHGKLYIRVYTSLCFVGGVENFVGSSFVFLVPSILPFFLYTNCSFVWKILNHSKASQSNATVYSSVEKQ